MLSHKLGVLLKLIRYKYHFTSALIFLGAIFAKKQLVLTPQLLVGWLLFLTLYSGLYIVNDLADFELDSHNPDKKSAPLQAGSITKRSAFSLAMLMLTIGLGGFLLLDKVLFLVAVGIFIFNLLYTFVFKQIIYLDIITNAAIYPVRFYIGVYLATGLVSPHFYIPELLIIYCFVSSMATLKRILEIHRSRQIRKTLIGYSDNALRLILLAYLLAATILIIGQKVWIPLVIISVIFLAVSCISALFLPRNLLSYLRLTWRGF